MKNILARFWLWGVAILTLIALTFYNTHYNKVKKNYVNQDDILFQNYDAAILELGKRIENQIQKRGSFYVFKNVWYNLSESQFTATEFRETTTVQTSRLTFWSIKCDEYNLEAIFNFFYSRQNAEYNIADTPTVNVVLSERHFSETDCDAVTPRIAELIEKRL